MFKTTFIDNWDAHDDTPYIIGEGYKTLTKAEAALVYFRARKLNKLYSC